MKSAKAHQDTGREVAYEDSPSFAYHIQETLRLFVRRHTTYFTLLFILVVGMFFFAFFSVPQTRKEITTVGLGQVAQWVDISGRVEASRDANLAFQNGGEVAFVGVKQGDKVSQGKVLATLLGGDAQARLLRAEAEALSARTTLLKMEHGAQNEELTNKVEARKRIESSLAKLYTTLPDAISNVDAVTADLVKNTLGTVFVFTNGQYSLSFKSCDKGAQEDIESKRNALEETLASFQKKSGVISTISSQGTVDETFSLAYQSALATNELIRGVSNLLLLCNNTVPNVDVYKDALSQAKASMASLFAYIFPKRNALIAAKSEVNKATRELALSRAGTDPYKIQSQYALVAHKEAQVAEAKSNLSKTIIIAPFGGVVRSVETSLGKVAVAGKTVISMLATDGFEVDVKVPERDIATIVQGARAEVVLNAYGKDTVFPATVTHIDKESIAEGSDPMRKVTITLDGNNNERIKEGMSARVRIITISKDGVLAVPYHLVKVLGPGRGTVLLLVSGKEEERRVRVGFHGNNGRVEITHGLTLGDQLVPFPSTIGTSLTKTLP